MFPSAFYNCLPWAQVCCNFIHRNPSKPEFKECSSEKNCTCFCLDTLVKWDQLKLLDFFFCPLKFKGLEISGRLPPTALSQGLFEQVPSLFYTLRVLPFGNPRFITGSLAQLSLLDRPWGLSLVHKSDLLKPWPSEPTACRYCQGNAGPLCWLTGFMFSYPFSYSFPFLFC